MTKPHNSFRYPAGLLDTCVCIDLPLIDEDALPIELRISTVTLAELGLGTAMTTIPEELAIRTERLLEFEHTFDALPFSSTAARRFTSMSKLVVAGGRNPKPRRMDLMIAAIASANDLPLFTRNPDDFKGIEALLTVVAV
ncbi:type II toxin-antitoxin system VapC family toxin [Nocardia nova]|uniref:type II toxin-antitoxin system VapC family toxin n=1 Tax=Nocardia nova TaxID=37330 RepID=UPI00189313DC|nr:type II toxin-antitoxin system VapC family toxin [Nocardia nova]MBF6150261.1 type II toxin-antitoxin system VapC family toxin [Nocardia nova]MDN2499335.1 type II toxin-antitoxin system VapC family toxin [Nocardia nova]